MSAIILLLFQSAGEEIVAAPLPRGGDDAPRSHVGIAPKLVRAAKSQKGVARDDIEAIYDRVVGLVPDKPTKAQKKVLRAVAKAVEPYTDAAESLPPATDIDFAALEADVRAVAALQAAHDRLVRDEEEAVIALLLAA